MTFQIEKFQKKIDKKMSVLSGEYLQGIVKDKEKARVDKEVSELITTIRIKLQEYERLILDKLDDKFILNLKKKLIESASEEKKGYSCSLMGIKDNNFKLKKKVVSSCFGDSITSEYYNENIVNKAIKILVPCLDNNDIKIVYDSGYYGSQYKLNVTNCIDKDGIDKNIQNAYNNFYDISVSEGCKHYFTLDDERKQTYIGGYLNSLKISMSSILCYNMRDKIKSILVENGITTKCHISGDNYGSIQLSFIWSSN